MPKLLLNLRNVPEDEADDVRAMLEANRIPFYETKGSPWGISAGGIWIQDDEQIGQAKTLMAGYQAERRERAVAERDEARRDGTEETFLKTLRRNPWQVLGLLALMVFIVLFTLWLPQILLSR